MDKIELDKQLLERKFEYWRDDEFHRDVYTNKKAEIEVCEGKLICANLEIFVDYYTMRVIWRIASGRKIGTTYYMKRDLGGIDTIDTILTEFAQNCVSDYGVDLNNYAV